MKKYLIGFIIGVLVFGTSVYAVTSYIYSSNEVSYTPGDSNWNVGNVKEALDNLKSTSGTALTDLKNTSIAKAVSANGSTLSSVINTLGGISNKGDLTKTINPGGSVSIAAGYYSGGKITANANQNSGTYTPTSRSSSLDMGANNTYRYVNTNSVPNTNSGTYNVTSNGTKDMGANNTYRYVNVNVPNGGYYENIYVVSTSPANAQVRVNKYNASTGALISSNTYSHNNIIVNPVNLTFGTLSYSNLNWHYKLNRNIYSAYTSLNAYNSGQDIAWSYENAGFNVTFVARN